MAEESNEQGAGDRISPSSQVESDEDCLSELAKSEHDKLGEQPGSEQSSSKPKNEANSEKLKCDNSIVIPQIDMSDSNSSSLLPKIKPEGKQCEVSMEEENEHTNQSELNSKTNEEKKKTEITCVGHTTSDVLKHTRCEIMESISDDFDNIIEEEIMLSREKGVDIPTNINLLDDDCLMEIDASDSDSGSDVVLSVHRKKSLNDKCKAVSTLSAAHSKVLGDNRKAVVRLKRLSNEYIKSVTKKQRQRAEKKKDGPSLAELKRIKEQKKTEKLEQKEKERERKREEKKEEKARKKQEKRQSKEKERLERLQEAEKERMREKLRQEEQVRKREEREKSAEKKRQGEKEEMSREKQEKPEESESQEEMEKRCEEDKKLVEEKKRLEEKVKQQVAEKRKLELMREKELEKQEQRRLKEEKEKEEQKKREEELRKQNEKLQEEIEKLRSKAQSNQQDIESKASEEQDTNVESITKSAEGSSPSDANEFQRKEVEKRKLSFRRDEPRKEMKRKDINDHEKPTNMNPLELYLPKKEQAAAGKVEAAPRQVRCDLCGAYFMSDARDKHDQTIKHALAELRQSLKMYWDTYNKDKRSEKISKDDKNNYCCKTCRQTFSEALGYVIHIESAVHHQEVARKCVTHQAYVLNDTSPLQKILEKVKNEYFIGLDQVICVHKSTMRWPPHMECIVCKSGFLPNEFPTHVCTIKHRANVIQFFYPEYYPWLKESKFSTDIARRIAKKIEERYGRQKMKTKDVRDSFDDLLRDGREGTFWTYRNYRRNPMFPEPEYPFIVEMLKEFKILKYTTEGVDLKDLKPKAEHQTATVTEDPVVPGLDLGNDNVDNEVDGGTRIRKEEDDKLIPEVVKIAKETDTTDLVDKTNTNTQTEILSSEAIDLATQIQLALTLGEAKPLLALQDKLDALTKEFHKTASARTDSAMDEAMLKQLSNDSKVIKEETEPEKHLIREPKPKPGLLGERPSLLGPQPGLLGDRPKLGLLGVRPNEPVVPPLLGSPDDIKEEPMKMSKFDHGLSPFRGEDDYQSRHPVPHDIPMRTKSETDSGLLGVGLPDTGFEKQVSPGNSLIEHKISGGEIKRQSPFTDQSVRGRRNEHVPEVDWPDAGTENEQQRIEREAVEAELQRQERIAEQRERDIQKKLLEQAEQKGLFPQHLLEELIKKLNPKNFRPGEFKQVVQSLVGNLLSQQKLPMLPVQEGANSKDNTGPSYMERVSDIITNLGRENRSASLEREADLSKHQSQYSSKEKDLSVSKQDGGIYEGNRRVNPSGQFGSCEKDVPISMHDDFDRNAFRVSEKSHFGSLEKDPVPSLFRNSDEYLDRSSFDKYENINRYASAEKDLPKARSEYTGERDSRHHFGSHERDLPENNMADQLKHSSYSSLNRDRPSSRERDYRHGHNPSSDSIPDSKYKKIHDSRYGSHDRDISTAREENIPNPYHTDYQENDYSDFNQDGLRAQLKKFREMTENSLRNRGDKEHRNFSASKGENKSISKYKNSNHETCSNFGKRHKNSYEGENTLEGYRRQGKVARPRASDSAYTGADTREVPMDLDDDDDACHDYGTHLLEQDSKPSQHPGSGHHTPDSRRHRSLDTMGLSRNQVPIQPGPVIHRLGAKPTTIPGICSDQEEESEAGSIPMQPHTPSYFNNRPGVGGQPGLQPPLRTHFQGIPGRAPVPSFPPGVVRPSTMFASTSAVDADDDEEREPGETGDQWGIRCGLCQISLRDSYSYHQHITGKKHQRRAMLLSNS